MSSDLIKALGPNGFSLEFLFSHVVGLVKGDQGPFPEGEGHDFFLLRQPRGNQAGPKAVPAPRPLLSLDLSPGHGAGQQGQEQRPWGPVMARVGAVASSSRSLPSSQQPEGHLASGRGTLVCSMEVGAVSGWRLS